MTLLASVFLRLSVIFCYNVSCSPVSVVGSEQHFVGHTTGGGALARKCRSLGGESGVTGAVT